MSELGPALPMDRLHTMAISLHMKPDGTGAWPSQKRIAERCGSGERTVKRSLKRVQDEGWLDRVRVQVSGQKWRRTEYRATIPDHVFDLVSKRPSAADPSLGDGATVAPSSPDIGPLVPEQGADGAGQGADDDRNKVPSFGPLTLPSNSSSNTSEEERPKVDGLDPGAWDRWIEYQREIGRPVSPSRRNAVARDLAAFGDTQAQVVERSVAKGWKSLFALPVPKPSGVPLKRRTADEIEAEERAREASHAN